MAKKEKEASDVQKAQKPEQKAEQKSEESGFNVSTFLQGTKEELDKVVWPSRQQLISESVAVILMVTLSATLIYLVDNFFGWAARQVF
ncbi:preprotein translocase subunit SecE [Oculatella sp. LEGE 06141]|uniref:preprotein translocase subunit SecE n=1 Tax=Oculatella sp. LEGE 06141 TaxID=1828648 RepID=UPI0018826CBC|nr:preprotein translocase subunit SecE [Oculatella sp. LEGE 06141]